MRLRLLVAGLASSLLALSTPSVVYANEPGLPTTDNRPRPDSPDGDRDDNPVTVNENGDVVVTASTPGVTWTNEADDGPRCWSEPVRATENDRNEETVGLSRTNPATGEIETWMQFACDDGRTWRSWVSTGIDTAIVIDGAIAQAIARIPRPTPDVNPAPDVGSYVNLGMWLAVTPPEEIEITASVSTPSDTFSVTATVELLQTTFDPGDGRGPVTCEGHGEPIDPESPAFDEIEQGPCGHTYLQSSPEDDPFQLAITSTHQVSWVASDGRTGSAGDVDLTTVVDYDVDELQTVGSG